jgi:hypothetical protein
VDGVEREVGEEGFAFVARDERDGFLAKPVGEVAGFLHHVRAAIDGILRVIELEVVVRAAPEEAEHLVEAAMRRTPLRRRAEVPLAELRRGVARRLEELREQLLAHRQAAARLAAGVEAEPLLITARHQARARRRADVAADVALPADDTRLRQRVEMRRADLLRMLRVEQHVRIAKVIGDNDDEVRLRSGEGTQPRDAESAKERGEEETLHVVVPQRAACRLFAFLISFFDLGAGSLVGCPP